MTHSAVKVQIAEASVPSTPSWLGEVAVFAQVLTHLGLLHAIQEHVRFAHARFGQYDTIDFVVVLIGYALSGEPTLKAYYARLLPFADTFLACFGRDRLPDRSTRSRFLAALDQASMEALRTLFLADVVARTAFATPGELSDRQGNCWWVMDVDRTQASCSPTRSASSQVSPCPSSSDDPGVCSRLPGAEEGRSHQNTNDGVTGIHASVGRNLWRFGQWGLSG